jgi:hypothetical protein
LPSKVCPLSSSFQIPGCKFLNPTVSVHDLHVAMTTFCIIAVVMLLCTVSGFMHAAVLHCFLWY